MTTFVEEHRVLFMSVTIGILAWAFYLTYRKRPNAHGSRSKIMAFNKGMLWVVTALVIVFLFFPQTITNLMASNDGFTSDMDRTFVTIEGMT